MIQLFLLLCGTRAIRRKWWVILAFGLGWLSLGLFFMINALIDEVRIPSIYFAIPMLLDGMWSLATAFSSPIRTARWLRLARAGILLGICALIVLSPRHSGMIIALIIGPALIIDGCWHGASAVVIRYEGWRVALLYAAVKFVSGWWLLQPWPTHWQGEVGSDVGTLLFISGIRVCYLAWRIRRLPLNVPVLTLFARGWPVAHVVDELAPAQPEPQDGEVVVHVWTPTGKMVQVNRGISRYMASMDQNGTVSTGHAALELVPDLYISHYPAVEIDRDRLAAATLLATKENNVAGKFQPSYQQESREWCPSTMQVRLAGLNTAGIRKFWASYRTDATYNLTNRNCSTTVAKALDAGLEGLLERRGCGLFFFIRLLLSPEFMVAGFMRRRAAAMTWTPGIVLDYARAIAYLNNLHHRMHH
ncbi:MAG: hypothetical protein LBK60_09450 [Verrucomicrobiales bacterium]|jgi:uncharacterized membrane protein HdeD (DUF308 family)|nr:hypothetical protein [Verrucomicrobiales bacterium]